MDLGILPNQWKDSFLLPISKSGDESDIKNYRGISLLSAVPMIFELFILKQLHNTYKHYIVKQFFKGRSTSTSLCIYYDYLVNSIDHGLQVDFIYCDISKAFDSVIAINYCLVNFRRLAFLVPFIVCWSLLQSLQ